MSLVVAIYESTDRYALAADSLATLADGGMSSTFPKAIRVGNWLVGFTGGVPAAYRWRRQLSDPTLVLGDTREAVETALQSIHAEILAETGTANPGEYPRTGATVLLVGPAGICEWNGAGWAMWEPDCTGLVIYRAIGCAVEYATGWLDCAIISSGERIGGYAESVVNDAASRFPAVGGPVTVLLGPA